MPFCIVVGTNTTYLSNAVNQVFHCNVKTLINWYRVQYAKTVLSKKMYSLKDIPFVCESKWISSPCKIPQIFFDL